MFQVTREHLSQGALEFQMRELIYTDSDLVTTPIIDNPKVQRGRKLGSRAGEGRSACSPLHHGDSLQPSAVSSLACPLSACPVCLCTRWLSALPSLAPALLVTPVTC